MLKHTVRNVTGNIATEENHTSPTRAHLEYCRHLRIRKEVCDAIALSCLKMKCIFFIQGNQMVVAYASTEMKNGELMPLSGNYLVLYIKPVLGI